MATGQWYHVALSRVSGNTRLFLNGTQEGSTYVDANNYVNPPASRPVIGAGFNGSGGFAGWMDDIHIVKGEGLYTANFTPPTSHLDEQFIAGTNILALNRAQFNSEAVEHDIQDRVQPGLAIQRG